MNTVLMQKVSFLAQEAQSWAQANGLIMGQNTITHCPLSLIPFQLPVSIYQKAINLSTDWNLLIDRISRDTQFLIDTLSSVAQTDDFTRRLLKILKKTQEEGIRQPLSLGLYRCDYMFEGGENHYPLNVEINTISSAFGALTDRMSELHKYLISRHFPEIYNPLLLPENHCLSNICHLLSQAFDKYAEEASSESKNKLAILMIVRQNESNSTDQRLLEYQLWENYQIRVIRRTLSEIYSSARCNSNHELIIDGLTIAVAYFRSGYTPDDFPGKKAWKALLMIERCLAIKCPSVATHLAGSKKVQQTLSQPGCVEKFMGTEKAQHLRKCFTGLWGLNNDDASTREIIELAIQQPNEFVLKPQREGGGNNIWGQEIAKILSTASIEERSAYILMKKIRPVKKMSAMIKDGKLMVGLCSTELGIFSGFLGNGQQVFVNTVNGHLLRTKFSGVNEGGVAAGYAFLDSPCLVSQNSP